MGWRWWSTPPAQRSLDHLVAALILAAVLVLPLVAVRVWWATRSSSRRRVVADLTAAVVAVVGECGEEPVRVRSWHNRVLPARMEIRWAPGWDSTTPSEQRRLVSAISDQVKRSCARGGFADLPPYRWTGDYQHHKHRAVMASAALTVEEQDQENAAERVEELVKKTLAGTRSVKVIEWAAGPPAASETHVTETPAPVPPAKRELVPVLVEATYKPTPKVASAQYRLAVETAVGYSLPGRWRGEWLPEQDSVRFFQRPGLPRLLPIEAGEVVPGQVAYGLDEDGNVQVWDMKTQPHVLIVGPTGGGKTSAIRSILVNALRQPDLPAVAGIDPKMVELVGFEGHPGVERIATSPEEAVELLRDVTAEMWRRYEEVRADPTARDRMRPLIVVLDEFFILRLRLNRLHKAAGGTGRDHPALLEVPELLALARTARIHLIIGIQRPDAEFLSGNARDNLRHRISLTKLSLEGAQMMWGAGSTAGCDLPTIPGRAMATDVQGKPVEVQVYFTPDPDPRLAPDAEVERVFNELRPAAVFEPILPVRVTECARLMKRSLEEGVLPQNGPAPSGEVDVDELEKEQSPAEPLVSVVRAEELLPGDLVEIDDSWVELAEAAFDENDEDLVNIEWSTGTASLPSEEPIRRRAA